MSIVALRAEWIEIWPGKLDGIDRWFIELCDQNGKVIVHDCTSESEARSEALEWGLPVILA